MSVTRSDGGRASETIRRLTLADEVADRLREDILQGAIRPGERIVIGKVESRFGVSHIPIREALRRLEAEGLVEVSPNRATIATGLHLDDLVELYDLRRLLEAQVAARAVERRTPEQLEELLAIHSRLERIESSSDPEATNFWQVHREFHWAILAPGATSWIRRIVEQLWQSADRYVLLHTHAKFAPTGESIQQHRGLAEACARGVGREVHDLLCEHLSTTEEQIRSGYLAMQSAGTDSDGT